MRNAQAEIKRQLEENGELKSRMFCIDNLSGDESISFYTGFPKEYYRLIVSNVNINRRILSYCLETQKSILISKVIVSKGCIDRTIQDYRLTNWAIVRKPLAGSSRHLSQKRNPSFFSSDGFFLFKKEPGYRFPKGLGAYFYLFPTMIWEVHPKTPRFHVWPRARPRLAAICK